VLRLIRRMKEPAAIRARIGVDLSQAHEVRPATDSSNRKSDGDGDGTKSRHERRQREPVEGVLGGMKATRERRGRDNLMTLAAQRTLRREPV
jgi:hypothetical protein